MKSVIHGYVHEWKPGPKLLGWQELRVNVPLRFPRWLLERVDAVAHNRTRFIESAVRDALEVAECDVLRELRNTKSF